MTTVISDGPFDAARNPALLILQEMPFSAGLYSSYLLYNKSDASASLRMENSAGSFSIKPSIDNDIDGMNFSAAFSMKLGSSSVLGISITEDYLEDQISTSKQKINFSLNNFSGDQKVKTTEYKPLLSTALAYRVSTNSSIGFQASLKYIYKNQIQNAENHENSILAKKLKSEDTLNAYSLGLGIGYLLKDNKSEIGLLLRTGRFTWSSQELSYNFDDMVTVTDLVDDSKQEKSSYSASGKYTEGLSLSAGISHKIDSLITLSLDTDYAFKHSYTAKQLEKDDFFEDQDIYNIIKKTYKITKNELYTFKAGIEVALDNSLSLLAGLGYAFTEQESTSSDDTRVFGYRYNDMLQSKFSIYLFSLGGLYKVRNNLSLNLNSSIFKLNSEFTKEFEAEGSFYNSSTSSTETISKRIKMEFKTPSYNFYIGAGAVYSF